MLNYFTTKYAGKNQQEPRLSSSSFSTHRNFYKTMKTSSNIGDQYEPPSYESPQKYIQKNAITDSFYSSQMHEPAVQEQRSVRTSAYIIPDQGSVEYAQPSRKARYYQSTHEIVPRRVLQVSSDSFDQKGAVRSRSYEDEETHINRSYEHHGQTRTLYPKTVKSMTLTIQAPKPPSIQASYETKSSKKTHVTVRPNNNQTTAVWNNRAKDDLYIEAAKPSSIYRNEIRKTYEDDSSPSKSLQILPQHEFIFKKTENALQPHKQRYEYSNKNEFVQQTDTISAPPYFIRRLPPVLKCYEGQPVRFEFEVGGLPEPQVTWFKEGMHVQNTPDTRITSNLGVQTLTIPEVFSEDSGLYKVVIQNPLGTLESYCQLIVEGFEHALFFLNIFIFFIFLKNFLLICIQY
jgi:hypothetical protein